MFIERTLTNTLKKIINEFPVVALTGPRQSGKTTLVKHVFPDLKYVSLEDPDRREFAQTDPRGFLANCQNGVILDEVQRVPDLFSYIQGIVDAEKCPGQFILTGSQHFLLHEKISQSLAGRVAFLTLLPLSLEELYKAGIPLTDENECMVKGFYPRLYDTSVNPHEWYANYLQTYVERDVRQIKNITDLSAFQRFVRLCAGRVGQLLNLSSLAHDCGITHNTARSWLSVLEASFILFFLEPHHKNFNKRLVKMPKLYFYDTGLASALLGINHASQLTTHPLRGNLFECLVVAELAKHQYHRGERPAYSFWRDKVGHEVDCVLEHGNAFIPIEIKSGRTITADSFKGLAYWNTLTNGNPRRAYVVYAGDEYQERSDGTALGWRTVNDVFHTK